MCDPRLGLCLAFLLNACVSTTPPQPSATVPQFEQDQVLAARAEFMPVEQLAAEFMVNVVRVDVSAVTNCAAAQTGFGLVVSNTPEQIIALPKHIVKGARCQPAAKIQVTACHPQSSARPVRLVHLSHDFDLAFVRGASQPLRFQTQVMAPQVAPDDETWLLGFDGDCAITQHGRYLRDAIGQTFLVSAPALGGSSGGILMTEWGMLGQVLAQRGRQRNTVALPLRIVIETLEEEGLPHELVQLSDNTPPQSLQAARKNYGSFLSHYLFYAQQIYNTFSRGEHGLNYLLQNIPPYNQAYIALKTDQEVFLPHLNRYWPQYSEVSTKIIQQVHQVHAQILALNKDLDALAEHRAPTDTFEPRLARIGEMLTVLTEEHEALMVKLNE